MRKAVAVLVLLLSALTAQADAANPLRLVQREGYVDSAGALIYYKSIGDGPALMLLHGGPGATHDYMLPHLLPLARVRQLVFIDERGSGHSQRLSNGGGYTLGALVDDVENVRRALQLGSMDVLGHSFGGILAQAYALKYPQHVGCLVLAGTGSSAAHVDGDLQRIKKAAPPAVLARIEALEAQGIYGEDGAQLQEYRRAADEALAPYMYVRQPPWDTAGTPYGWDAMRALWGDESDFMATGDLKGFDFLPRLRKLDVRTLVIYGDHDIVSAATAQATHAAIARSQLVQVPRSGHEMYVDQPAFFLNAVEKFLGNCSAPSSDESGRAR